MIAKKQFIINQGSDSVYYRVGGRTGGTNILNMKQWEIQGYSGGMGYRNQLLRLGQECQKQNDKQPKRTGNGKFSNYFIN